MNEQNRLEEETKAFIKNVKIFDARIKTPFCMIITGASQSGKTFWLLKLLKNRDRLIDNTFINIIYFYGQETINLADFEEINITCVAGIPDDGDFSMYSGNINDKVLFIFDDLLIKISNNKNIAQLVLNKTHHENISVIFLSQDLFYKGSQRLTINRQAHYIVLLKTILDKQPYSIFAKKFEPNNSRIILDIFNKILNDDNIEYGYVFIDGKVNTPEKARIRYNIFNSVMSSISPKIK